ncbi:MAG: type II secretion system F family protein [Roseiarcus sp.]|jgi:tight adherence protein B
MVNNLVLAAGCAIVACGGLAFVFVGGESRAGKRRVALKKAEAKAEPGAIDKVAKKKQLSETLKDMEKKSRRARPNLQRRIEQAGLQMSKRQFMIVFAAVAVALGGLTFFKSESPLLGLLVAAISAIGLPNLVLARLRARRINKFIAIFPNALDILVRSVKAGLPLADSLRIIANEAPEPVRSEFRKVVEAQTLGLPLPEAVEKMARRVPVSETNFFAIVIGIQTKAGGNLSEAVGNLSRTLRERKKMTGKISAMAMEAKASAVIIGAVPFVVTGVLYLSSPGYISLLWTTQHGRIVAAIAIFWMSIGVAMMKKMISFDF